MQGNHVCAPELADVQGVGGRPENGHLPHDEHHDFRPLVVRQVASKKPYEKSRHVLQIKKLIFPYSKKLYFYPKLSLCGKTMSLNSNDIKI